MWVTHPGRKATFASGWKDFEALRVSTCGLGKSFHFFIWFSFSASFTLGCLIGSAFSELLSGVKKGRKWTHQHSRFWTCLGMMGSRQELRVCSCKASTEVSTFPVECRIGTCWHSRLVFLAKQLELLRWKWWLQ